MSAWVLAAVLAADADLHWEKIRDKDGITVYRSEVPGTAVVAFKGSGRVEAPLLKVAHVIIDPSRGTEWVDSLAESRVLRSVSSLEFLEYDRFAMPLFIKDRDFVSRVTVEPDAARRRVVVRYVSVDDPAFPPTPRCVRGELVRSAFSLQEDGPGATRVDAEILCDPRGALPKWLVNFFQKSWPVSTLQGLRRQAVRPDVTDAPTLKALLAP
jgi:hypothetical protein